MRVVVAPDSFGGTLTAGKAADAVAEGWLARRPVDDVVAVPMSDGGEGLLDVVAGPDDTRLTTEVVGSLALPVDAAWLLRGDGTAVIESAAACGLRLVPHERRNPLHTTTHGVGELLLAARQAGVRRVVVGLGGSATVDGGTGALIGLGFRLWVADGSGLKIGGADLDRVVGADRGWSGHWHGVEVELLADVTTPLPDAARVFGPQKGATPEVVDVLARGLDRWADVAERDLAGGGATEAPGRLRDRPGAGAAGGLGFGLAAGISATTAPGAATVAGMVGLPAAIADADLVVTGEGRVDATTSSGKVVHEVARLASAAGVPVLLVAGQVAARPDGVADLEAAAPDGPGDDPAADVAAAARRLAGRASG